MRPKKQIKTLMALGATQWIHPKDFHTVIYQSAQLIPVLHHKLLNYLNPQLLQQLQQLQQQQQQLLQRLQQLLQRLQQLQSLQLVQAV